MILFAPYTECNANLNPDGTCAEGALEPDCCECDTDRNAIHTFYKTASGECIRKYSDSVIHSMNVIILLQLLQHSVRATVL